MTNKKPYHLEPLTAISPIDGRYADKVSRLRNLMSEFALIRYRILVEIQWILTLSQSNSIPEIKPFSQETNHFLQNIADTFSLDDAMEIKKIERETNHDVKAVEYFLKNLFEKHEELADAIGFIHFGCTSEDINNLAYALMLRDARNDVILPSLERLTSILADHAKAFADKPLLSRTHGQPASPSTMGKEFANVIARLDTTYDEISNRPIRGKFNGAVGNFNAHISAYPSADWHLISSSFVKSLGLEWQKMTTQIEPHDDIAALCHSLIRLNTILIDFNRDTWGYISIGYFRQKSVEGEIGSSTMPHKINPIDFENSEGNAGISNALLNHLAEKLPISRWQRDLSDSTVLRNFGPAFAHSILSIDSMHRGLKKIEIDEDRLKIDLEQNYAVLAEAIQTVMRKHRVPEPYEKLKAFTRGNNNINSNSLMEFVESLPIPDDAMKYLINLTPATYIGNATTTTLSFLKERLEKNK